MKMNKHGITKNNLLRTFPEVLAKDSNMLALATIVAEELSAQFNDISQIMIYSKIESLPEDVLDILAYDFKVDWWDYNYTLEEKRQTLKDSWNVHRSLGTKGAVEKAISAIYPETKVSEWFEYNGEPYYFKLLIDIAYENINPEKHQRVLEKVEYYKNLRSRLDGIEYVYVPVGYCEIYGAVAMAGMGLEITVEVKVNGLE